MKIYINKYCSLCKLKLRNLTKKAIGFLKKLKINIFLIKTQKESWMKLK